MLRKLHVSNLLLQNVNKIFHLSSFGMFTVKNLQEVQSFWLYIWFEYYDTVLSVKSCQKIPKRKANMQITVFDTHLNPL